MLKDDDGNTSKRMPTKIITILGNVLSLTGRHVASSSQ